MRHRGYITIKNLLEKHGFTVSSPKFRFIVEYTLDEYVWTFDNLAELGAFAEGIEAGMEFSTLR